jgi:cell wall-associated NlpC family hydrolase
MSPRHVSDPEPRLLLPGSRVDRSGHRRTHRVVAALLAVGLVAGITLSGAGAGAQSVESLRARAAQIANELEELEQQSGALNERYLELTEQLEQLEAEQSEIREQVEAAQARVEASRSEAAGYLVEAYIGAGAHEGMALGSADPNEAVNSQVMLEILRSDRNLAADEYAASKSDLQSRSAELESSEKELQSAKERQEQVVAELESSVARQEQLLANTNDELDAALEAERQRREAEAAARAEQAAREAAASAAAAAAQRSAAATATTAPRAAAPAAPRAATAPATTAPRAAAPAPAPAPVAAPNGRAAAAVSAALSRLGTPYRWGGTTPAGFDCSGLMLWSWAHAGVSLPRTSGAQRSYTQRISFDQLQPGDLVFSGNPVSHVGMYIGGGQMVHSPQTGDVVKVSAVRTGGSVAYGRVP